MKNSRPSASPHDSARANVTGKSWFVDDRPFLPGELLVGVVTSRVASGTIRSIDISGVSTIPGIVGIYTAKDLKSNLWGSIFHDQPFLADDQVNFVGEAIALVAGTDRYRVAEACQNVRVIIDEDEPIFSIEGAIERKSFMGPVRTIERGTVEKILAKSPHVLSGLVRMQGQDHFYLESQASVAYPVEGDGIEVHSSSQHPTEVQHLVAAALGLRHSQVTCIVKRMGGAFGGKESQAGPYAVYAALVAYKTGRPARCVLTKDEDMISTGKRNPFTIDYRVGFDSKGGILALDAMLHSDGGAFADLSTSIMERALLHMDNAYYIEHMRVCGRVCRTNHVPTTAFRGFGGPKGVLAIESIIEEISQHLKIDSLAVRQKNVYQQAQNNTTHYGQMITTSVLPRLFADLAESAQYQARRNNISQLNKSEKNFLYGMSLTAVKFGISFTTRFLNQGNAIVNLHLDGSVQVSTGATEMGQGVNTKIADVVAQVFGIASDAVVVMPTSTEKNHNTSPTAASSGSDINGQAAMVAALTIRRRLESLAKIVLQRPASQRGRSVAGAGTVGEICLPEVPGDATVKFGPGVVYCEDKPDQCISLIELLEEAYLNRISLGERGFYRYPDIHFNKDTGQGRPFLYFTNGVAVSEVKIDRLTGELKILRSDILMDLGRPINFGIDKGQVTGGFIQGVGWVTTENLFYDDTGSLRSHSPSTYKIPSVHDIPREFNVALLEGEYCEENLRGSKAVGEPPLLLGISVWTAVKNALSYVCPERTKHLRVPATAEEILRILEGDLDR